MFVLDAHCDSLLKVTSNNSLYDLGNLAHLDIKRALNQVNLQVFAAYIETAFKPFQALNRGLNLIEIFHQEIEKLPEQVKLVLSQKDLTTIDRPDLLHVLLAIEGGEILAGNLLILKTLFRLGVRSIGLTWNQRNEIADGCGETITQGGLTTFGIKVIKEMNDLGMIIDLAHISTAGFWSALNYSGAPLMVSHANCYGLCPHRRNLTDEQIKALAENQGVMGITFVQDFLGQGRASIEDIIKHIDYAVNLAGINCVGLGSDFDGTDILPVGLDGITKLHLIGDALSKRGYTQLDIEKIMGGNFLKLFINILPK